VRLFSLLISRCVILYYCKNTLLFSMHLRNVLKNNFTKKMNVCGYFCKFIAEESKLECKDTPSPEIGFDLSRAVIPIRNRNCRQVEAFKIYNEPRQALQQYLTKTKSLYLKLAGNLIWGQK
jgi:hypothetical protein